LAFACYCSMLINQNRSFQLLSKSGSRLLKSRQILVGKSGEKERNQRAVRNKPAAKISVLRIKDSTATHSFTPKKLFRRIQDGNLIPFMDTLTINPTPRTSPKKGHDAQRKKNRTGCCMHLSPSSVLAQQK